VTERSWTSVAELTTTLRKRWSTGRYLREYAAGEAWQPISLPVRSPKSNELLERFDEVNAWLAKFHRDSRYFRVEYRTLKGRDVGANEMPVRVWVDTFDQLCRVLDAHNEVNALDVILESTQDDLRPWVVNHPLRAIENAVVWPQLMATVDWVTGNDPSTYYLRHIDVDNVDTKFIERHQALLHDLLLFVLPPDRVNLNYGRNRFAERFMFRPKPSYVRLRFLSPEVAIGSGVPASITELMFRADELSALNPRAARVFIIENEATYLSFPEMADAIAIFGSGFAVTALQALPWMESKQIVYWGDIDTYGFAILNQLRAQFPTTQSMLMDRATLLAHEPQWVTESSPITKPLANLSNAEAELYVELIEDRYGYRIRLEQERVRFSLVNERIERLYAS
jgi:hypothetical protein